MLLLKLKGEDILPVPIFSLKTLLNKVWIRFRIWIRNRSPNFSRVGTRIAIHRYPQHWRWLIDLERSSNYQYRATVCLFQLMKAGVLWEC